MGAVVDESVPAVNSSLCSSASRFQMLHIPDIRVETFTGSPEKFNAIMLVIALIAPLLA